MAEAKEKNVKVKFAANTAFNGKVQKKDAELDVPESAAKLLVDGKHAALVETKK